MIDYTTPLFILHFRFTCWRVQLQKCTKFPFLCLQIVLMIMGTKKPQNLKYFQKLGSRIYKIKIFESSQNNFPANTDVGQGWQIYIMWDQNLQKSIQRDNRLGTNVAQGPYGYIVLHSSIQSCCPEYCRLYDFIGLFLQ